MNANVGVVDGMDINGAIITMKAYKELDNRIREFSNSLENVIIRPRFDLKVGTLSSIDIQGVSPPRTLDRVWVIEQLS